MEQSIEISNRMFGVVQRKAQDLYRCKGVLKFKGTPEKFVFHGVHEQVQRKVY